MKPIASGERGEEVAVSLEMGEYAMRPVYICPGAVRDQSVLYASSSLIEQQYAGGRVTCACAGVPGMFYRVAIRAKSLPSAVELTAPKVRAISKSPDRRAALEDFREGWYYDSTVRMLLVTYQDSGAGYDEHTRISVRW
jgi:hypothetical protein